MIKPDPDIIPTPDHPLDLDLVPLLSTAQSLPDPYPINEDLSSDFAIAFWLTLERSY